MILILFCTVLSILFSILCYKFVLVFVILSVLCLDLILSVTVNSFYNMHPK